jgi:hypothetical protein
MIFNEIGAVGDFLKYYYTDLWYIANFQRFIKGQMSFQDYLKVGRGSFYKFLIEFKIIRNVEKGSAEELLRMTRIWCGTSNPHDVDAFAQYLKECSFSRNATLSSLASKVLFLNNPWEILPMDALGRKALSQKTNQYSDYLPSVATFAKDNSSLIDEHLSNLEAYCKRLEREYRNDLPHIETIRKNRFIDKLLWVQGSTQGLDSRFRGNDNED